MVEQEKTLAERILDGQIAKEILEYEINVFYPEFSNFEVIFDDYCSIELLKISNDFRFSKEAQKVFKRSGFKKIVINHKNGWETHYYLDKKIGKGWRVRYHTNPHEENKYIEVENKIPDNWPKEWLETGYIKIIKAL